MKRTIAALALVPVLALGATACSEQDQKEANEAASDAGSAAQSAGEDAASAAEDAASAASDAAEDVDWEGYADDTQQKIDDWAAEDNCSNLNDYVEELDPDQDGELITYVKDKIAEAGCA